MKSTFFFLLFSLIACSLSQAQTTSKTGADKNVVVILIDGYRWQELFKGADFDLLNNKEFNTGDSLQRMKKFWSDDLDQRRKKLMPFTWNYIAKHGQLYGNRDLGNNVNVMNPYWFSYPGRAEIFSGFVDTAINSNDYPSNPNTNFFEFVNGQKGYKDKVAAFTCWRPTGKSLGKDNTSLLICDPWEDIKGDGLTEAEILANETQHFVPKIFGEGERLDVNMYALAKSYILARHPKLTYIEFGDTDEYAHEGKYENYLLDIFNVDGMIEKLWNRMQQDPFYKNNTTFYIVPDHGRGVDKQWTDHGNKTPRSNETWLMVMGPDVKALGELKTKEQIFETQFAKTIVASLGFNYSVPGKILGKEIKSVIEK